MRVSQPRLVIETDALLIWGTVLTAWALALLIVVTGQAGLLRHDAVLEESTWPGLVRLLLFLLTWQVMTAGMMLPSSMPMVGLFARVSRGQRYPRRALGIFLAAYFAIWTGFAILALAADAGLHAAVEQWAWLDRRPWLITGGVLLLAGAFQFSPLKERCLRACRSPAGFLWQHYQRGLRAAWVLGLRHGLFCLGCCWALMLVMFAVGVGNIAWMAALAGVMIIEKTMRWGRSLVPVVGTVLIVWGLGLLLLPG